MKGYYDAVGLYHDGGDPRVIVPKRVRALGWTINVGHRNGRFALTAVAGAIAVAALLQYG